jgi:hypothetical protein
MLKFEDGFIVKLPADEPYIIGRGSPNFIAVILFASPSHVERTNEFREHSANSPTNLQKELARSFQYYP